MASRRLRNSDSESLSSDDVQSSDPEYHGAKKSSESDSKTLSNLNSCHCTHIDTLGLRANI